MLKKSVHATSLLVAIITTVLLTTGKTTYAQVDATNVTESKQQLQRRLKSAAADPLAMYNAVRVVGNVHNRQWNVALRALEAEIQKHPRNAIIRAGYVLCFNWQTRYPEKNARFTSPPFAALQKRNAYLQEAKKIAPDLWLTKVAEAAEVGKEASITDLQKAVELAPNISVTHYKLGEAYMVAGRNIQSDSTLRNIDPTQTYASNAAQQARFYAQAEKEFLKATLLPPVDSGVWQTLCYMYLVYMPNKEKARSAWREYLRTVPTQDRLSISQTSSLLPKIFKSKYKESI